MLVLSLIISCVLPDRRSFDAFVFPGVPDKRYHLIRYLMTLWTKVQGSPKRNLLSILSIRNILVIFCLKVRGVWTSLCSVHMFFSSEVDNCRCLCPSLLSHASASKHTYMVWLAPCKLIVIILENNALHGVSHIFASSQPLCIICTFRVESS